MTTSKINFNALDVAKVVAAVFVVSAHMNPFESGSVGDLIVMPLPRLAVPFFFIASSFLFFLKQNITGATIRQYVKRMFILYGFWIIPMIPIIYLKRFAQADIPIEGNLLILLRDFCTCGIYDGFYFIMCLIQCVPLVYFLSKRMSNTSMLILGAVFYSITAFCKSYYIFFPESIQDIALTICVNVDDICHTFLNAFIYVVLGKMFADNNTRISVASLKLLLPLFIISLFFYYLEMFCVTDGIIRAPFTRVIVASTLFPVIIKCQITTDVPYKKFRSASTIIFFAHLFYIGVVWNFYYHITVLLHLTEPWMRYLWVLCMSICTYFVMSWASQKKCGSWLKYGF